MNRIAEIKNEEPVKEKRIVAFYRLSKVDTNDIVSKSIRKRRIIAERIKADHMRTQREIVTNVANQKGWKIIAEFEAVIGRNKVKNSMEFQRAFRFAIESGSDLMLSTFDRIGDELFFTLGVQDELRKHGLKLWFADYLEADEMIIAMKILLSKKEREIISKRQRDKAAIIRKYGSRSGRPPGNPKFKDPEIRKEYGRRVSITRQFKAKHKILTNNERFITAYIIELKRAGYYNREIVEKAQESGLKKDDCTPITLYCVKTVWKKYRKPYERTYRRIA